MRNPKTMPDEDILDLIWQKDPAKYDKLVREINPDNIKIIATRKTIINTFREVYCGNR